MKTKDILTVLYAFALLHLVPCIAFAQQEKKVEKEEYRLKLVHNDVNGEKHVIDTAFHSKEALENFQKETMKMAMGDIDQQLKKLYSDSTCKDLLNKFIQLNWKKEGNNEGFEVIIDDSVMLGENMIMKHVEIDEATKKRLMNVENGEKALQLIKMLDINVDADSLVDERGSKNVTMIAIFKSIEVKDPNNEDIKTNKHPQIKQAAGEKTLALKNINVYPNPSNGKVFLDLETEASGEIELLVTDMQGKEIFKDTFYSTPSTKMQRNLNIDGQKSGIYLLKITSNGKSIVKKLILEN